MIAPAGRGLGVRPVDDLQLRGGQVRVAGARDELRARRLDPLADDIRRFDAGGVVARDRKDSAARQPEHDRGQENKGGETPARNRSLRADVLHDRRRLAEDARDEGGRQRLW